MRRFIRDTHRGQELVEFAIILPVLLLMLLGTIDLGRAVYGYSALHFATREGARVGAIPANGGLVISTVRNAAVGLSLPASQPVISYTTTTIRVCATYNYIPAMPLIGTMLGGSNIPLTSCSTMQLEE